MKSFRRLDHGRVGRSNDTTSLTKVTGWQGIQCLTPAEWNVVAYSGDTKNGSVRIDNRDSSGRSVLGVELRWSTLKSVIGEVELTKRLDHFLAGIVKGAKKQNIVAAVSSESDTNRRRGSSRTMRKFTWRADRRASGTIWYCSECSRLVIAQVVSGTAKSGTQLAKNVLDSIECHSSDPLWRTWSLYDLLTEIPSDYQLLGKPELMNIYVQLGFNRGASLDSLSIEQWGVANVQLRGKYLNEWFREKNSSIESTLTYTSAETEVRGHPALLLSGKRTGLKYWFGQALPQAVRLQLPVTQYDACIWECPESNKIHLVQSLNRRHQAELVHNIVERTVCHCS